MSDDNLNVIDDMPWEVFSDLVTQLKAGTGEHPFTYQEWLTQENVTDAQVTARINSGV